MRNRLVKKMSRHERVALRQQKLKDALSGKGSYIFANNTSGDLSLPKKALDGKTSVGLKEEFNGDSYFLYMVKTNDLKLVKILNEESIMDKLITEQPPVITNNGKVEFVVNDPQKKINEEEAKENKKILLTEDPMGGIVIVD